MIYALIILTFLLAIQTVRVWLYKYRANVAMKQNEELNKVLAGARVANEILADALEDEEPQEWPSEIG